MSENNNEIIRTGEKDSVSGKDTVIFGKYGGEPVRWLVLEKTGSDMLLLAKQGLCCMPYNDELAKTSWEKCSLRNWLNNDFLSAFSEEEKALIKTSHISTPKNEHWWTTGGNDTEDMVFLLSVDEARQYFESHRERICQPAEYERGALTCGSKGPDDVPNYADGGCFWWLRTPGYWEDIASVVNNAGDVDILGDDVNFTFLAVRPALRVRL